MSKDKGGPAFPDPGRAQSQKQREMLGNEGMTLRDYFAAKAMQTLICDMKNPTPKDVSEWAYRHADAMLTERLNP